ncbi:hypothetical protein BM735_01180 [Erysipelotrichaceae bacterium NYU-BL-F16]|nr:hypothetical protein BM735_01180 [Erysipelotrichaceae bacterium NYU-BL-F16]
MPELLLFEKLKISVLEKFGLKMVGLPAILTVLYGSFLFICAMILKSDTIKSLWSSTRPKDYHVKPGRFRSFRFFPFSNREIIKT